MNMFGWASNSRVRVRTEGKEEWIFIEGNYVIPSSLFRGDFVTRTDHGTRRRLLSSRVEAEIRINFTLEKFNTSGISWEVTRQYLSPVRIQTCALFLKIMKNSKKKVNFWGLLGDEELFLILVNETRLLLSCCSLPSTIIRGEESCNTCGLSHLNNSG